MPSAPQPGTSSLIQTRSRLLMANISATAQSTRPPNRTSERLSALSSRWLKPQSATPVSCGCRTTWRMRDFVLLSVMIQKALASGADAFYPASYEGDQMNIARQMRELDANFPMTYMFYGSQPQFLEIGEDAKYLFSQTLLHEKVNWKVNAGLNRDQMVARYGELFPDVAYTADFQTALAYGAGAVLEEIIKKADSIEPAALKQAAIDLSKKITVMTGPYEILETGKQIQMEFVVMQNQEQGLEVVYPESIATAKPVLPVPDYSKR